ncbi:nuclear transport factor 2 family protein [Halomontanus rarus]|uniref:nuclear transport factor 2 family protein n=1 Tax=Halomontanus rarus TaxID=3034020 RepID=UPI0023E78742|nr:nuclear transport factor 2 family protein [Halovivax sp. TS33]
MSAEETVRDYYDALRNGEALGPFFVDDESAVKFGISESLFGGDEVGDALREQTETTEEWTVESHRLTVEERDELAWFADEVTLEWTVRGDGEGDENEGGDGNRNGNGNGNGGGDDERHHFETRWSGTLARGRGGQDRDRTRNTEWLFHSMHVSAPQEL